MRKINVKLLTILLMILSIVTSINVILAYWFPAFTPLSSFAAMRLAILAVISRSYWLLGICLLICGQLFLTALFVRRHHILLPVLSLVYEIIDFSIALSLLCDGLSNGYWGLYIIQVILSFLLIVSLIFYCITEKRARRQIYY